MDSDTPAEASSQNAPQPEGHDIFGAPLSEEEGANPDEAAVSGEGTTSSGSSSEDTGDKPANVITPSGIEIRYTPPPNRGYDVRPQQDDTEGSTAEFEWTRVPSCSEITKILDKPGLVHWGEQVGINLVQEIIRNEWADVDFVKMVTPSLDPRKPWWTGKHLQEIGKQKLLTNYYMKEAGGAKGNSVHRALEFWAMSGVKADPEIYPEGEQGYVIGLNAWIDESGFEPRASEVMVASYEHKYAGRFDLMGELPKTVKLVSHLTEKGTRTKKDTFEAGSYLPDLKTTAGVYEDQHLQIAGYLGACEESGYKTPDTGAILRVTHDGRYEFVLNRAQWMDFWFLRGLYDGIQRMKGKA